METELARTFLTVVSAGNFISAAGRLNVTQSTVSARIQSLERELGCALFVRNKGGTSLTPAGRQFQRHALSLVRTLEEARQDVGVPAGFEGALTIGGRIALWDRLLLRWLPRLRAALPRVSIRAEIGFEEDLMASLVEGRLDMGVMYTPQSRPGLLVEPLIEDRLVLVSTREAAPPEPAEGYVFVDWGPEFRARHAAAFPDFQGPELTVNIGWLGLEQILAEGGCGYFPLRLLDRPLAEGRLRRVEGAPDFALPAYLVYPREGDPALFDPAVESLMGLCGELRRELDKS